MQRAKADLQAKDKNLRQAQAKLAKAKHERNNLHLEKEATSDDDDNNVPIVALVGKARSKKSARPRWVYEPVMSTASKSPYWDTLGVESITACVIATRS